MKKIVLLVSLCVCLSVKGQVTYGTTGLMQMPTADMQQDKTFLFGGTAVDHRLLSRYWRSQEHHPFTYLYYVNVTFFPWLEVGYMCTLVKGKYDSSYWPTNTWGRYVNQDRSFHGRLRLWKEGWWKSWTPQIVLGANDPGSHSYNGGGSIDWGGGGKGNHNYLTRFYLAATKHVEIENVGEFGMHAALIAGRAMEDVRYNRPAVGVNFKVNLPPAHTWQQCLNGLNVMAEICPGHDGEKKYAKYNLNMGLEYGFWKDHINVVVALNDGRYFSGGLQFRVHL